jgi:hypothetical protein
VAGEHPAKICGRINLSDPVDTTGKEVKLGLMQFVA